ncbi:MAG: DUF58 domain-containing protein [Acidimicrobiales bacterium]
MTRSGAIVLALAAGLSVSGVVLSWPAVLALGIALGGALAIGVAGVFRPMRLVVHRHLAPSRVSKGGTVVTVLTLENRSRRASSPLESVQRIGERRIAALLPRVRGGELVTRAVPFTASDRGVFELSPVETERRDLFGFFRVARSHGRAERIWVYPRDLRLHAVPSGRVRHLEGPSRDLAPAGDITFHRLREYAAGDDRRSIHWRSTARRSDGTLLVRHNVDTSQPYTVVLLDLRPAVYSSTTFEEAVDVAASVAVAACRSSSPAQLRMTDGTRVGGHRQRDPSPMLERLAAVTPQSDGELAAELLMLRRERGGTTLVAVTGAASPEELPAVAALRRRFDRVVLVAVADPAPPLSFPGTAVISATTADEVAKRWDGLGLTR